MNIRPGKTILKGSYENILIMGLPGNPVSALITFEVFLKSLIHGLGGVKSPERRCLLRFFILYQVMDVKVSYGHTSLRGRLDTRYN